jgi:hypothetical protein
MGRRKIIAINVEKWFRSEPTYTGEEDEIRGDRQIKFILPPERTLNPK